jgi:uncharacterized SAM-binding protein YcdF (DUF218 family)
MTYVFLILAFAAAVYGYAVMRVKSGTWFFAVWYVLAAVLLCLSAASYVGLWSSLPALAQGAIEVLALLLLAAFAVALVCALSSFREQPHGEVDCLIVLGAQVSERGPSAVLTSRLDAAKDYLRDHESVQCVVSGAQGPDGPCTEADAMADYLVQKGIRSDRIVRERESRTTLENIRNSRKLVDEGARVCIVTNDFHLFRGVRLARKHGFPNACGLAAPSNPLFLPNNLLRESFGIIKGFLCGNL